MARQSKQPVSPAASPDATSITDAALSYEAAYARLETVLAQLEGAGGGDLPLEVSLALYEEGARLAKICAIQLDAAELRVRQWQPSDGTTSLDDWSDELGE